MLIKLKIMKMKNTVYLIFLFAFTLLACERDYTCDCLKEISSTCDSTTTHGTISEKISYTIHSKRNSAKASCNIGDSESTVGSLNSKTECELM